MGCHPLALRTCADKSASSMRRSTSGEQGRRARITSALASTIIRGSLTDEPALRRECAKRISGLGRGPNAFNALISSLEQAFSESVDASPLARELARGSGGLDTFFEASLENVRHPDSRVSALAARSASAIAMGISPAMARKAALKAQMMLQDSSRASRQGACEILLKLYTHSSMEEPERERMTDSVRYRADNEEARRFLAKSARLPPRIIDVVGEAAA